MIQWRYESFVVDGVVPSKNSTNWKGIKGKMASKKKWRDIFASHMLDLDLPRPLPMINDTPLLIVITIRFSPKSRGNEWENYAPAAKECLADALWRSDDTSAEKWIRHDSDDLIKLTGGILPGRGERNMLVELQWAEYVEVPIEQYESGDEDDMPELTLA